MFACLSYNDKRESILKHVLKNKDTNSIMSDTQKISYLMEVKHRKALNFIEKAGHKRQSIIIVYGFII